MRYLQGAAAEADRLIVAVNDDRSVARAEGRRPADPAGGRSRRARRRAARRRLRRRLRRRDRRAAAAAAQAGRALQRHRLHRRHRCPSAPSSPATAAAPPSSAIRRTTRRATCCSTDRAPLTSDSACLIVRLGALGDIVHAIPVAAALRRAFPAARIDWLVSAKHREILDLVPVIDRRLVDQRSRRRARAARRRMLGGDSRAAASAVRRRDRPAGADQVGGARAGVGRRARRRLLVALRARAAGAACSIPMPTIPARGGMYDPRETRHVVDINLGLLSVARHHAPARRNFRSSRSIPTRRARCASRPAAATRCSTRARRGRTNAGRRRGWRPVAAALRARHGLMSVVLWGPGEEALAAEVVAGADGAGAAVAEDDDRRSGRARARRGADGVGRHRPDAHRRGRRHADRRHLRADASGAQRPVVAGRRHRLARQRLPVPSSAPVQARRGCACSTSRWPKCSPRSNAACTLWPRASGRGRPEPAARWRDRGSRNATR